VSESLVRRSEEGWLTGGKLQIEHLLVYTLRPRPVLMADLSQGDVGGQKTLRTYWKNYFEKTDTLIWVVDATDRERLDDCRQELKGLLVQEVRFRALPGLRRLYPR